MKNDGRLKVGQIMFCDCEEQSISYSILVTNITKDTVAGRIGYSSSAYGSAVVEDFLEEGKKITLRWEDIDSYSAVNDEKRAAQIRKAAKDRIEYAKNFIRAEGQVMQRIDMKLEEDHIAVTMASTLPSNDSEDVPWLCKCWYRFNGTLTPEKVTRALTERFTFVSGSGVFLPETKVIFKTKSFKFEGTLESGVVICGGIIPDELLRAMNLFIDTARSQYGMSTAA